MVDLFVESLRVVPCALKLRPQVVNVGGSVWLGAQAALQALIFLLKLSVRIVFALNFFLRLDEVLVLRLDLVFQL